MVIFKKIVALKGVVRVKIKIGQKVYLQKYEVAFITHEVSLVPASFMNELFSGGRVFVMSSPEDGYTFGCVFEDSESVAWLMAQDWIVDYSQYKDKTPAEIREIGRKIANEGNNKVQEFNAKDYSYRREHFLEFREYLDNLEHKVSSIEIMADYLDNKIKFSFPDQIDKRLVAPKTAKKPGFFARLFGRGAQ